MVKKMVTVKKRKPKTEANSTNPLVLKHIHSLADFIIAIKEFNVQDPQSIWYRGISRQSHLLVPSLFRSRDSQTKSELVTVEEKLNRRFRDKSLPYLAAARDEASDTVIPPKKSIM